MTRLEKSRRFIRFSLAILTGYFATAPGTFAATPAELQIHTLSEVKDRFHSPPAAYRPAPLYVWNDDLREEEIARQLQAFKEQGFGGVFIHPRPGLIVPYLSLRWLELWRFTVEECKKRGMYAYIYDENSYPSGFAGGHVPDRMPESRAFSIRGEVFAPERINEMTLGPDTIALYRMLPGEREKDDFERIPLPNLSASETAAEARMELEPGAYLLYSRIPNKPSDWFGGKTYVDLLRPGVTSKFLEVTLGAYDTVLSDEYGKNVLACFTDEPECSARWTVDFPEAFEERCGYDILDCLYSLDREAGDWKRVRHDFSSTLLTLYIERFAKPYYQACDERGIALTGHVWEHGWPQSHKGPDTMSFNAWQHIPGIDCLFNNYSEGPHAQLGNYRASAEIRSIANQLGKVRTLCEAYGGAGWELTFEDMKRIGDYLYVTGVNFFDPILSFYSLRGERKRDYPTDLSYHSPWWEAYHISADYFARLSWALSSGRERNELLVIEPTTTMWMYDWSSGSREQLERLGAGFQRMITELAAGQIAFDLGSEPVIADRGSVRGGRFHIGERSYSTVVLPPGLENLERTTVDLLDKFVMSGGCIVSYVGVPGYIDGRIDPSAEIIKQKAGTRWIDISSSKTAPSDIWPPQDVVVSADEPEGGRVFHLTRELDDGCLLFVVNTSLDRAAAGFAAANGKRVEIWDSSTGTCTPIEMDDAAQKTFSSLRAFNLSPNKLVWDFHLPPAGSALFAIWNEGDAPSPSMEKRHPAYDLNHRKQQFYTPRAPIEIQRLDPNVLLLDYADLILNGGEYENLYYYDAQTRIYKAHGFERNPWKHAIQFENEIDAREVFPEESGFELRYPFTIETGDAGNRIPNLKLVLERGELYEVTVNGHSIQPVHGDYWIDPSFNIYPIESEWLQAGRNVISTIGRPFSIHHEPQPVCLLGDFALRSAEKGWTITSAKPLEPGGWSLQGMPFYAGRTAYTQQFTCAKDNGEFYVELADWNGIAARVDVNGHNAGYIGWRPWKLPVTKFIQDGTNAISVTVFGSFKNLWGPHHRGPVRGNTGPFSFPAAKDGQPPGERYDAIEYGLNAPFKVYSIGENNND